VILNIPSGILNIPLGILNIPLGILNIPLGILNIPQGILNFPRGILHPAWGIFDPLLHLGNPDGLFTESDRVELSMGDRREAVIANPHAAGGRAPTRPDVLPRRAEYYLSAAPTAKDAVLVVEIADSSVAYDRNVKSHLCARHQIREYWLLDLPGKVEVYRRPGPAGYREVRRLRRGGSPDARVRQQQYGNQSEKLASLVVLSSPTVPGEVTCAG